MPFLEELQRAFRIADAVDIAFIALFLYAVLAWFKEAASRAVLAGLFVLAVIYFVARAFDMYMTVTLFQAVFAVLLIALVVIFQEDIRRGFERIAVLGRLGSPRHSAPHSMDTLVESAADLAVRRIGALIVLYGREPLGRHLEGGLRLDGEISKPLLDSIFDPHSAGHDGAVIIGDGRLRLFAAHLPISKNLKQVGQRGTRHSAALGLSEVSDALVIVVSEEQGTISVAEGGKLQTMASGAELKQRLERFHARHFPARRRSWWQKLLAENAWLKVVSLLLACFLWFFFCFQAETVQKSFLVPVEYRNLPEQFILEETAPVEARITLEGYDRAFRLLDPAMLRVALDLSEIRAGLQTVPVSEADVRRPSNLELESVEPRLIMLRVEKWVATQLPVDVTLEGSLPEPRTLGGIQVKPAEITAQVWESERFVTRSIPTEPVDLSKLEDTTTRTLKLRLPRHLRLPLGQSAEVQVTLEIKSAKQKTR